MEATRSIPKATDNNVWKAVDGYRRKGWRLVPVDRGKGSTVSKRSEYVAREEDFTGNLGLLVGDVSGGVADVDADCPEAEFVAQKLLPLTSRFGRDGRVRHHLFVSPGCGSKKFTDVGGETLVELRANTKGDGEPHLTVVPPGTHKSGQSIEWLNDLEPREIEAHELRSAAGRVAAAALIARHLPDSGRHDIALAYAGLMLRPLMELGETREDAVEYVWQVLRAAWEQQGAGEKALTDLYATIEDTAEKIEADEPATGGKTLKELLTEGEQIVKKIKGWFGWGELTPEQREAIEQRQREKRAEKAIADPKVSELAHAPDILARVCKIMQDGGLVGEERNAKLLTLVAATMHLGRPMSFTLNDDSSSGKSYLLKQLVRTLPDEMLYKVQSVSNMGLSQVGKYALKNRFLLVYELGGLGRQGSEAIEQLKQLLTEGNIRRQIAESTNSGVGGRMVEVDGPTALLTTTTETFMDRELSNRMFRVGLDTSPEQTRKIIKARRRRNTNTADYAPVRGFHTFLAGQDNRVVVPFEDDIADLVDVSAGRMRRDFDRIMDLVEAHAVLHQGSRERQEGCIVATLDDYEAVYALIADIVGEASEVSVSDTVRETVELVRGLIDEAKDVTRNTLAEKLGIVPSSAGRRFAPAMAQGFVKEDPDNPHQKPKRYVLGNVPLPENVEVIPSPETLTSCVRASVSGGGSESPDNRASGSGSNARSDARMHARSRGSVVEEVEESFTNEDYGEHHGDTDTDCGLSQNGTHGRTIFGDEPEIADNGRTVHASVRNIVRPEFDPAPYAHDFRDAMADGLIWNSGTTREQVAAYHGTLAPAELDAVVELLSEPEAA